jgi:hypothetical protein
MSKLPSHVAPLTAVGLSAASFYLLFRLNDLLFQQLDYAHGVSWLFLPSGLRLGLVLLFGFHGAIGVMLGSLLVGLGNEMSGIEAVLTSLISGLAPWLGLWVSVRMFRLRRNLSNLSAVMLLKMAVVFALLSAAGHQLLYLSLGLSENFLKNTSVMALGDLAGTLVVIYGMKLFIGRRTERL